MSGKGQAFLGTWRITQMEAAGQEGLVQAEGTGRVGTGEGFNRGLDFPQTLDECERGAVRDEAARLEGRLD